MCYLFLHLSLSPACSRHRLSFVPSSVCTSPIYMRLHAHDLRPPHHIYAACMLPAPPIICSNFFLSTPNLYAPACSRSSPNLPPVAVCILTAPPSICSNFCLYIPNLYAPACSRSSPTSPHICRLHAHGTAYHLVQLLFVHPHFMCACILTALA